MVLDRMRFTRVMLAMLLLAALSAGFALFFGPSALGFDEVVGVLLGRQPSGPAYDIILHIRLPRMALAMLVGACLAVSGVVFQALLRNPLADPFVLGVSGGAALGGIVALSFGAALGFGYEVVPPAAFAGALLTTLLLYLIAGAGGRVSATNLLLTGVVFNSFASAAIVFLASISGFTEGSRIYLWLIGNLSAARTSAATRRSDRNPQADPVGGHVADGRCRGIGRGPGGLRRPHYAAPVAARPGARPSAPGPGRGGGRCRLSDHLRHRGANPARRA